MDESLNLSGEWQVYIDFEKPLQSVEKVTSRKDGWTNIQVPGCWEQIEKDKLSDGPVWYRKTFRVPPEWNGQSLVLAFEGVNYFCEIWLNGERLGAHEGGWNGFSLDTNGCVQFEKENDLLVKIYKQGERFPVREHLAGFLPDVGVIFGGIWKAVHLRVQAAITSRDLFFKPRIDENAVEVELEMMAGNVAPGESVQVDFCVRDLGRKIIGEKTERFTVNKDRRQDLRTKVELLEAANLWSPETPVLYTIEVNVQVDNQTVHKLVSKFGMKEVKAVGDQIFLNGTPVYLRGVLHWGWYGDRIAPIPSREEIKEELKRIKQSGFNMVKHCLYVPTQDYYELADEMGVLIWQELPMWLPEVKEGFKDRAFYQYERIIKEIRSHPSIILWTLGCELGDNVDSDFLEDLYDMTKQLTNDSIVRDNSGSGECYGGLLKEYADFYDYHFYNDIHFYTDLINQFAGSWRETKPWLFGEFCDYDIYRDIVKVREKHGGLPWWLKKDRIENPGSEDPRWKWCEQEEKVEALNLPFSHQELHENSIQSAFVYRKTVLELVRRYEKIAGYSLTSIQSNPVATSAIYDDFGNPYHNPEAFRDFNDDAVLLLTWDNKRNWINGGDRLVNWDPHNYFSKAVVRPHLFLSHYRREKLQDAELLWRVSVEGESIPSAEGSIHDLHYNAGEAMEAGVAEFLAPEVNKPTPLNMHAEIRSDHAVARNEWRFWVFPAAALKNESAVLIDDPLNLFEGLEKIYPNLSFGPLNEQSACKVVLTTYLRHEHYEFMKRGGNVLYVQRGKGHFPIARRPFWRESLQLFYRHPLVDAFPHENHTSLALFGLATDTVFEKDHLPKNEAMVDRLDARTFDLHSYMFETEVAKGRLLATTLRFEGGLGSQPSGIDQNPAGLYWLGTILNHFI